MLWIQVLVNGLALGGLYACIAAGFSLVWGVLNIINILHGSLIVLGGYLAFFAHQYWGVSPFVFAPVAGLVTFALGYVLQRIAINPVMGRPVLITLVLTFGLNLFLDNAMLAAFKADYRKINLQPPPGILEFGSIILPVDRVYATAVGLLLVGALWLVLRFTQLGRAIIAVRMDRDAAALMGINVRSTYALAFALGTFMAGSAGALLAAIFPVSPVSSGGYLGKAFVICVLGGLGSMPGVVVGGFALGVIESFGALALGPENALTISFLLLIVLLIVRPTGLLGRRGFN
ncbi:branched-chain amino acid ABC transporter permease [Bradyrhizobium sp. U87765 SZCCT0131]|uniref:branched-chain amino acid ABC transporter permease n=1 Tax=unclassified Bradyrhizobium TaxID=2631580 RepID=UPI001BA56668|nr:MULTISPECIES: branched-chain amino acid ABC transporter permease [unclassified Bradyrhizobium]MBR1218894.1 branched-chain amino acid ABC transporter permease [Bradyrhizobium sp. U87765 SZCCT0131]MBR1261545.1 branched-chain amino acid ABC transporter permease [Bradyrhizobium sp. U87765 SZCCT0134]MBR1306602.1 branched-chain amino acid ABC transporter permease [Bradyrhizobium sp. U87765 SZCCT0110]MBR1317327.1 branched-chain amino acid ABC transporter permease [Bradyrhizobium sp. U87765 SZCCT010